MVETIIKDTFPLSLNQRNIWNLEQAYPGTPMNNITTTVRVQGRIDLGLLEKSICLILKADPSLRTRICVENGQPLQYQVPYSEETFFVYDFSNTNHEGVENWEKAVSREIIQLLDSPLYRFYLFKTSDNSGGVIIKLHHLISDGWSQLLLCNRISDTYLKLLEGKNPQLGTFPSYRLHVEEEKQYLVSKAFMRDEKYWKKVFNKGGIPAILKIQGNAAVSPVGNRLTFQFSEVLNHLIYKFCVSNRVAPFSVFYMALAIYFQRMSGESNYIIGVPVINRTSYEFKQSTGMFVSTLPFFCEIQDDWNLMTFHEHMLENWYELLRHQRYPFSYMNQFRKEEEQSSPLFHIALSYQDGRILENRETSISFSGNWQYSGYQAEHLCIHLSNLESERRYSVDYDYLSQLFSKRDIMRFHEILECILKEMLNNPQTPIRYLNILRAKEREQVLYNFNKTDCFVPGNNLKDTFCYVCKEYPHRAAVIFEGNRITYQELYNRGIKIGRLLQEKGAGADKLAAVLLPRTDALFNVIAGAMLIGCGWLLLPANLPKQRINKILKHSQADILVTVKNTEMLSGLELQNISVINLEDLNEVNDISLKEEKSAKLNDLAYMVYTSGSTGEPKGVEISQGNLLNLAYGMRKIYGKNAVLSVCGIGFDAFVLESSAALLNGQTIVLASEEDCESPRKLAKLIRNFGVGFLSMTPSRLSAYMQNEQFFSSMRQMECIICGGESFPVGLLNRLKTCTHARIYNQYGPTETTVAVSMKLLNNAESITIGKPMDNCRIYILDEWKNPLPPSVFGQLYIGGRCVGMGYRGNAKKTEEVFCDSPFEEGEKIYRTGDIACWTDDGEIQLAGREDTQVKLRGLRIEPSEIAACMTSFPGIRESAVVLISVEEQEHLAAYYTETKPGEVQEMKLRSYLASLLPEYMIPDFFIVLNEMPMTANGKIDRKNLPLPEEKTISSYESNKMVKTELTIWLTELFANVLGRNDISPESDYFLSGGNSLNGMEILMAIEEYRGRKLRISDLYACRTPRRLAALIEGEFCGEVVNEKAEKIKKAPLQKYYKIAPVQQGMYIQHARNPENLAYHMPGAFRFHGKPDLFSLEKCFQKVVESDPILQTGFLFEKNEILAKIVSEVTWEIEKLTASDYVEACSLFLKPFEMDKPPLLRAAIWKETEESWILFLDCHHIIGDGMSTPVLLKRIEEAYEKEQLDKAKWTYYDYLYNKQETSPNVKEYWKNQMSGITETVSLPKDKKREFDYSGEELGYSIQKKTGEQLTEFCKQNQITPFMVLAAVWGILQARITQSEDLIVGTPVSGRNRQEFMEACGPFINTLPLRMKPAPGKDVSRYLEEVRNSVNNMLENAEISLEEILSLLNIPRKVDGNGLYNTMISMRPVQHMHFHLDGREAEFINVPTHTAKMDIVMEIVMDNNNYMLYFEYASCYMKETIEFYARTVESILSDILNGGLNKKISQVTLLSNTDRYKLWEEPFSYMVPFANLPIHKQIQYVMNSYTDRDAVIWHGENITYGQLSDWVEILAGQFSQYGLQKGDRIGLLCKRTPQMYAAIIALLRIGCTYVPLLASFPEKRLQYIMNTAEIYTLVCDKDTINMIPECLKDKALVWNVFGEKKEYTEPLVSGKDIIHILFTSGSTGNPKGVMIRQSSIANLLNISREWYKEINGPMIAATTITFDIFASEGLIPLALGKTILLADEEEMLLPWKLANLMQKHRAEFIQFTASRLQMCLNNDAFCHACSSLRFTIVGGEPVSEDLVSRFHQFCEGKLVNLYGPTEATVYTTMQELKVQEQVTIGKPLPNYRVYLLDKEKKPVMPTAVGEIYIAGSGVADGYVGQKELTEQAFIPDLFFPGEMMYKSGDLGRQRLDGRIEYLGRIDDQVKINGQRVEIAEIETVMKKHEKISEAAVLAVKNPDGSSFLQGFAASEKADADEIRSFLMQVLPEYMVPVQIIVLPVLPYTEGGKIDRVKLAEIMHSISSETNINEKKSVTLVKDKMRTIWEETLGNSNISESRSFFEQGGTSLTALNVLSQYFNEGIEMTMAQFYRAPYLKEQIRMMEEKNKKSLAITLNSKEAEVEPFLNIPQGEVLKNKPYKTVFLTGATGYFGIHLLKEILDEGTEKVICLVRGGWEQLVKRLSWYFGEGWLAEHASMIETFSGDLKEKNLGLDEEKLDKKLYEAEAIYHCAADVRHYVSEISEMEDINVKGTEEIIRLACKYDIPLHHISTASVAGRHMKIPMDKKALFTENDLDIGQKWEENVYVKTKFLAEQAVYQAMQKDKLKAHVYRLGMLVQRSSDGVFQINKETNAAWLLLQSVKPLKILPEKLSKEKIDRTPVDIAAKMVCSLGYSPMTVFHIINPKPIEMKDYFAKIGDKIQIVSDAEFDEILKHQENQQILAPLIDRWNQLKEGEDEILVDSSRTIDEMKRLNIFNRIWGSEK